MSSLAGDGAWGTSLRVTALSGAGSAGGAVCPNAAGTAGNSKESARLRDGLAHRLASAQIIRAMRGASVLNGKQPWWDSLTILYILNSGRAPFATPFAHCLPPAFPPRRNLHVRWYTSQFWNSTT